MDFKLACQLLGQGARWGDVEVMDYEDIILDLQKRRDEIQQKVIARQAFRLKERKLPPPPRVAEPAPYVRKPIKRDFSKKAQRPCCIGCRKFTNHSNPPAHFTETDKLHCCAWCRITNGEKHGGSCEKNRA